MNKPGRDNARVIMHLDMDAFFVNVELLENPSLRGKPIIVAPTGPRSVVCSASYEARAHGVHSGMPLSCALSEVPHATILPLRADYRYYSRAVMGILRDLSPLVEQVSVDEAFVDLTGAYRHGQDPVQLAQRARERIARELSLPSSAGVAPNKLLAKMASTGSKPNGLWVVPPGRVQEFLDPRPVSALWGVGSKSTKLLAGYGIQTIAQLRSMSIGWLRDHFGTSHGEYLWAVARGIDDRPVLAERNEKSMGGEHTFSEDTADAAAISGIVRELSLKLGRRLRESGRLAGRLSLKIRYAGFETHTRSVPLSSPLDSGMRIAELALEALRADGILIGAEAPRPIRLIGVRAEKLTRAEDGVQQALFESIEYKPAGRGSLGWGSGGAGAASLGRSKSRSSKPAPEATEAVLVKAGRWSEVEHVMDAIQRKYSAESIKPASGVALPDWRADDRLRGAERDSTEESRDE